MWPLVATSPNDRCLTQKLLRSQWHCLELPVPQHGKALNHPQDLGCFLMLRILLFNSLLPFYSHVPRHSLFPFSKRKLYKSFASFQELTRHHTVMEGSYSCTTQHNWFTILLVLLPLLWLYLIYPTPFPEQQICLSPLFRHSYTIYPVSIVRGLVKVIFFSLPRWISS